ncbi:MAG TPA: peptidoglycan editing factor PgeF [Rhabdochlamydiaceae bacterium]
MIRKKEKGIQWLEFELFADVNCLTHGVFLRHGGVSNGAYASLDAGGRGGDPQAAEENRARICHILGISDYACAYQVHGSSLVCVEEPQKEIPNCDGMMTQKEKIALLVRHADCQAALFFDPKCKAIANVHCGWRGNVQNIYAEAVLQMQKQFGSLPENILVGISPSLGPQRSEFINYAQELPESFLPYQIKPTYFDLWAIARMQLEEVGILPHHIEIASLCTYEHPEDFFSYRRDQRITGNHATVITLK